MCGVHGEAGWTPPEHLRDICKPARYVDAGERVTADLSVPLPLNWSVPLLLLLLRLLPLL